MRFFACFVLLMLPLFVASAGHAATDEGADRARWRQEFMTARAALVAAQEALQEAKTAQSRQRNRDFPSGKAKYAINQAVVDAKEKVEAAEAAYLQLFERAHKEGAQPGWYRDFEDELPTLTYAEESDAETQFPEEMQPSDEGSAPPGDGNNAPSAPADTGGNGALDEPAPKEDVDASDLPSDEDMGPEDVEATGHGTDEIAP